jgi:hypothetical protein
MQCVVYLDPPHDVFLTQGEGTVTTSQVKGGRRAKRCESSSAVCNFCRREEGDTVVVSSRWLAPCHIYTGRDRAVAKVAFMPVKHILEPYSGAVAVAHNHPSTHEAEWDQPNESVRKEEHAQVGGSFSK